MAESARESARELDGQVFSFTMGFRILDQDAYEMALEDLKNAEVWAEDEGPDDNTVEENLEIIVNHLDVLAYHREQHVISYIDLGLERVSA